MKPPTAIRIDDDVFNLVCYDDEEFHARPYVDVRLDTVPPTDDDPDYSENPDALRKVAAWLVAAADWLEQRQGR